MGRFLEGVCENQVDEEDIIVGRFDRFNCTFFRGYN
jgi:hypothetical protein